MQAIFLMTDSQRWDMLNCYRDTGLQTPCLDRLASQGVRFERAYTTQPVCQPARAGIFFGQYPHSCQSWSNCMGISENAHSVGERLRDRGIRTAYIGKWHLDGGDYFGLGRAPRGWDAEYWYDMRNYLEELTESERRDSRRSALMQERDIEPGFTFGHRCADRALAFLERHRDEDFLLCVSLDEPHGPFLCPPPFARQYEDYEFPKSPNVYDPLTEKPDYQRVWAGARPAEDKDALKIRYPAYFGCNSFADFELGRILEAAERLAPEALVVYTSDHGDLLHSHALFGKGPAAYDEITRIPLLVKGPGIPAGRVSSAPVSHINLAPALLEWMGLPVPPVFEGTSLLPQAREPGSRVNDYVFLEFGRYEVDHDGFGGFQPLRCVFDGRYKLSINLLSTDELYDLREDPGELINRINDPAYVQVRNRLHDALLAQMDRTRDPFRGYWWSCRPWRADAPTPDWANSGMTRQREEEDYEPRQLDYSTGLPITEPVRQK